MAKKQPTKKKQQDETFDLFKPKQRLIYRYFNGQEIVHADPLTIFRRVAEQGPELAVMIKVSLSIHKDAPIEQQKAVKRIREIFLVKPFEEGGLTEMETVELFNHFMEYSERVKKNSSIIPISPAATSVTSSSSANGDSTITPTSDSGSIESERNIGEPRPLPTVQESPSDR